MESERKYIEFEPPTEIYTIKVLAGNIENVRLQLIDAVEMLDYSVIEDEPNIIARQGSKGLSSANLLDHPRTLTIRLKAVTETSTQVNFEYSIRSPFLLKGERHIVLQEAKTIAAISKRQAIEKLCLVCETESIDDSKFCRKCGAPLTSEQTELEVLRMMAETRAGKFSVVTSALATPISTILFIVLFILNNADLIKPKLFIVLLFPLGFMFLVGIISSFFGWNRLKRALEKPETEPQHIPQHIPVESIETGELEELPPRQAVASVIEGTTNLLDEEWIQKPKREKVPVSRKRETNSFD